MTTLKDQNTEETSYGIPVRHLQVSEDRSLPYVVVSDMGPTVAQKFTAYVAPCASPSVDDEQAFYVHDWERWNRSHNAAV